jgi:hypothetical protein
MKPQDRIEAIRKLWPSRAIAWEQVTADADRELPAPQPNRVVASSFCTPKTISPRVLANRRMMARCYHPRLLRFHSDHPQPCFGSSSAA